MLKSDWPLEIRWYSPVRKSWMAAIRGSPFLGVTRLALVYLTQTQRFSLRRVLRSHDTRVSEASLSLTPMRMSASALASSVCGRWRFISSPSKSALYGVHTHSLKRNVRWGFTHAWNKPTHKCDVNASWHLHRKVLCFRWNEKWITWCKATHDMSHDTELV